MSAANSVIDQLIEMTGHIEGWFPKKEGIFLYNAALNCTSKGTIVEIGSWKGKSTIWLGKAAQRNGKIKVYAIDPHTGSSEHMGKGEDGVWTFPQFKQNLSDAGVDDVVTPIVKTSDEALKGWDKPIELLFIDGAHDFDSVKKDFISWSQFLIEGGTVCLHDATASLINGLIGWPGPLKVANKYIFKSDDYRKIGFVCTMLHAVKQPRQGLKDKLSVLMVRIKKTVPDLCHVFFYHIWKIKFFKKLTGALGRRFINKCL
jgi:predicted O-methyltransferase YrrM